MSPKTTIKELKNMNMEDLSREERAMRGEVAKLHMGITLGKEKDTAKYKREKRHIARIKTVITEKKHSALPQKETETRVSASAPKSGDTTNKSALKKS